MQPLCTAQHLSTVSPHKQLWCLTRDWVVSHTGCAAQGPGSLAPLRRGWQRWVRWARAGAAVRCVCWRAQCRAHVLQRRVAQETSVLPRLMRVSWPEFKAPEAAASQGYKASSSGIQHGRPSLCEPSRQQTCAKVTEVPMCPSQSVDDAAPPQGPPSPHGGMDASELMLWAVVVLNQS